MQKKSRTLDEGMTDKARIEQAMPEVRKLLCDRLASETRHGNPPPYILMTFAHDGENEGPENPGVVMTNIPAGPETTIPIASLLFTLLYNMDDAEAARISDWIKTREIAMAAIADFHKAPDSPSDLEDRIWATEPLEPTLQ
jgi:hypothetical protein